MKINVLQRIVLILGAILLLINLFAPTYLNVPIISNGVLTGYRQVWDWTGILVHSIGIFLVCVLMFFGLASRKD
jgi:apolipoprotein N-acyltransferase